jgi:hypothetical protein
MTNRIIFIDINNALIEILLFFNLSAMFNKTLVFINTNVFVAN